MGVCTPEALKAAEAEVRALGVKGQEAREYYKEKGYLQASQAQSAKAKDSLATARANFSKASFQPAALTAAVEDRAEAKVGRELAEQASADSRRMAKDRVCKTCLRELEGALSQGELDCWNMPL